MKGVLSEDSFHGSITKCSGVEMLFKLNDLKIH